MILQKLCFSLFPFWENANEHYPFSNIVKILRHSEDRINVYFSNECCFQSALFNLVTKCAFCLVQPKWLTNIISISLCSKVCDRHCTAKVITFLFLWQPAMPCEKFRQPLRTLQHICTLFAFLLGISVFHCIEITTVTLRLSNQSSFK